MSIPNPQSQARRGGWFGFFSYNNDKDTVNDARNILLLVVTLITTVTFQAGVNPPGGVWQDDEPDHKAGNAIYADQRGPFYVFLISNTLAFSTSIVVLLCLTYKFPFNIELWVAILTMVATYVSAIFAVTPQESDFRPVLATAAVPFGLRMLAEIVKWFRRKCT